MPDITTTNVNFPANGSEGTGYLARPGDSGRHPGVIVIQEWWGLDGHIRDVAERFAREGFIALAPDLYHGRTATEPDEARKLVMAMNREQAVKDVLGAIDHLLSLDGVAPKKLGCIGFCMGGSLTLAAAAASPSIAAAAPFYPGMQPDRARIGQIQAEMFCAFGSEDPGIPPEKVREFEENLAATGRKGTVRVYEGAHHSFFNDSKPSYHPDAATDAWEHTLALFHRVLAP